MRHTGNRLHQIPQQSGRLRSAGRLEVVLSTVLAISSLEIVALEIAVGPAGAPSLCVAPDERCCMLLRWGDVLAVWCCNGTLWVIAERLVVMTTSRDVLFRVHEPNHFVTSWTKLKITKMQINSPSEVILA